jgi:protein TonB
MSEHAHGSGYGQRRLIAFGMIIALHILIAWAFIAGFGIAKIAKMVKDVQVSIIKQQDVKETPPPPPKPQLDKPPPVVVPPPLININVPIEAPVMRTVDKAPPAPPRPIAPSVTVPIKTVAAPDCGEDYYPSQAKRLEQEGSVVVKFCVSAANKIDGPIDVVQSSGFPALDEAAGKCIAAGRYKAGTVDGKPERTCKNIKVTYKLKSG